MERLESLRDEELFELYRNGRAEAFSALTNRYYAEVYRFLFRFTGRAQLAEDLVQETFLQMHVSADAFDTSRRLKPWLFTIAANKARDAMRSKARRNELALDATVGNDQQGATTFLDVLQSDSQTPAEDAQRAEAAAGVRDAVQDLPDHLREVLLLAYYEQCPYKDIAQILDIPLGTVKSRLHAAVKQLGMNLQHET